MRWVLTFLFLSYPSFFLSPNMLTAFFFFSGENGIISNIVSLSKKKRKSWYSCFVSKISHPSLVREETTLHRGRAELSQGHWGNKFENQWHHCQSIICDSSLFSVKVIWMLPKSENKTHSVGTSINLSENKLLRRRGFIFHWTESLLCEKCVVTFAVSAKWLFLKL